LKNKVFLSGIVLLLFCAFPVSQAYSINDKSGTSVLRFLKFGPEAKALGMGEAYTAQWTGVGTSYWNPAAISGIKGTQVNLTHIQWFQDITAEYFSSVTHLGNNAFNLSLAWGKTPGIEKRDEIPTTEPLAEIDAHDMVLSLSYARSIEKKYNLGFSVKWLYEKIDISSASGLGFDVGGIWSPFTGSEKPLVENFRFGAAILNLGSKMKFKEEKYSLPTQYKIGISEYFEKENWQSDFTVNLDVVKPRDDDMKVNLGMEYGLYHNFDFRLGYQSGYDDKNVSFGLGIKFKKYAIDYAFVPYKSNLGDVHSVSLTARF
jgi:hypothetical protein